MNILVGNRATFARPFLERKVENNLVLTERNSALDSFATANEIGVLYYESKSEFFGILSKIPFDHLFSAGCKYVIPEEHLVGKKKVFINAHPSLLPNYAGPHPITEALYMGGKLGVTIHSMGLEVDSGNLILQGEVPLKEGMTTAQKFEEVFIHEESVIRECLNANLFFREPEFYLELPLILPINNGFRRDAKFRILASKMYLEDVVRRISALSVEGHYAYIENGKKRQYFFECNHFQSNKSNEALNHLVNYEFRDGFLDLCIHHEEDI